MWIVLKNIDLRALTHDFKLELLLFKERALICSKNLANYSFLLKKLFHEVDFVKQPFFDKNGAENHDFFIIQQLFHKVYFVKQGIVPEDYMEHMIDKLITLKREGEKNDEENFAINQSDNINTCGSNNVIEY